MHRIEGVGAGFVLPLWQAPIADEIATDAGTSTGANLVAAIEVVRRLGRDAPVLTAMCDSAPNIEHPPERRLMDRGVVLAFPRLYNQLVRSFIKSDGHA